MVKLSDKRVGCLVRRVVVHGEKPGDIHTTYGVSVRRVQQLAKLYRETGRYPLLVKNRRPLVVLAREEKALIDRAVRESKLCGAVTLRLYIAKYYGRNLPYGKIHQHLLATGVSSPDKKKQKQRRYCRYERNHSFSLVHLDWHESKAIPGKWVCTVEDDASRLLLAGEEFDNAIEENNIELMRISIRKAFDTYSAAIREVNTDKGSQFYANTPTRKGERGESAFEKHLKKQGIKHIPSRRNHPQTNGKEERWFRTYEENRTKFKTFKEFMNWYNNKIHLGLNRKEGVTPKEAVLYKLQPESLIGLFHKNVVKTK